MKVYLSGPIYSDDKEATDNWRNQATEFFNLHGIKAINPCRRKTVYDPGMFTPNEIVFRDLKDVHEADLILVYFEIKDGKLSIGTPMEILEAWRTQKPVVLVSSDRRVITHPWIIAMTCRQYDLLSNALDYIVNFWKED